MMAEESGGGVTFDLMTLATAEDAASSSERLQGGDVVELVSSGGKEKPVKDGCSCTWHRSYSPRHQHQKQQRQRRPKHDPSLSRAVQHSVWRRTITTVASLAATAAALFMILLPTPIAAASHTYLRIDLPRAQERSPVYVPPSGVSGLFKVLNLAEIQIFYYDTALSETTRLFQVPSGLTTQYTTTTTGCPVPSYLSLRWSLFSARTAGVLLRVAIAGVLLRVVIAGVLWGMEENRIELNRTE